MLTYFPKYFSNRSIIAYIITLVLVSVIFYHKAMPFQFVIFGLLFVVLFFSLSSKLTKDWGNISTYYFTRYIFGIALLLRVSYVVFIYFYYIENTGIPHAFDAHDELFYASMGSLWSTEGFQEFKYQVDNFIEISDRGFCWLLGFENFIFGTNVIWPRLVKCVIDAFTCVLIYKLASRNFGESTGRMTAVFYLLMPNFWFYCGVTLKEIELIFMTVLFVERTDFLMRLKHIRLKHLILPILLPLILFTFRTALASVLLLALGTTLILSSGRNIKSWRKIAYVMIFGALLVLTVRVEMMQEIEELWSGRTDNQEVGLEWRAEREGGNSFARYAGAVVFAPMIFTIPFPTMVDIPGQENQMMLNGSNFVKNILSGFTIFALFLLLFRKEWRKHVLPIAVMCGYLLVLTFSNFAQSERFHLPALPFELMFASYGISQVREKHKRWFMIWIVVICIANIGWAWFKLAGRGMA